MANLTDDAQRFVLPPFRTLKETMRLGEVGNFQIDAKPSASDDFKFHFERWKNKPRITSAVEVLSLSLHNCVPVDDLAKITDYILGNGLSVSKPVLLLAEKLNKISLSSETDSHNTLSLYEFNDNFHFEELILNLSVIRNQLKFHYKNPMLHVEAARIFMLLNEKEKATRHMTVAVSLARSNRYVLRSGARLFINFNDIERAISILRKSEYVKNDPWQLASEIAISQLLGKTSRNIDSARRVAENSGVGGFDKSELLSCLATLEMENGKRSNARKLYKSSIVVPSENALAQFEWARKNERSTYFDEITPNNLVISNEAAAYDSYIVEDFQSCIQKAESWFFDTPYQLRSVLFGSHVANYKLNDHNLACEFIKAGLKIHPRDVTLLNNIAFYKAISNDLVSAQNHLDDAQSAMRAGDNANSANAEICLLATRGLLNYRKGNIELGRTQYAESISRARQFKSEGLAKLAFINSVREEILINSEFHVELVGLLKSLAIGIEEDHLNVERDRTLELYRSRAEKRL